MRGSIWTLFILMVLATGAAEAATPAEPLDGYLRDGRITEGLAAYDSPENDGERFSLAVLQVFDGLVQFTRNFNALGVRPDSPLTFLPFFRIAIPFSGEPPTEPATPEQTAKLFRSLHSSFRLANQTLSLVNGDDFGVRINLSQVHLDFDGNGQVDESEALLTSLGTILGQRPSRDTDAQDLVVRFDRADATWLRGYTHLLSGVLDILLAYDWRPVWDQCANWLFQNPEPAPPMTAWADTGEEVALWADLIAALHDMRLELKDREAWPRAREEFQSMIASSRVCWTEVLAETDNVSEWLPSPAQTGPRGATISQEQIDAWLLVLNELEAVTRGEKLLPHWRIRSDAGINLDQLVHSPPALDLVLWIQGSALLPYVEEGPVSDAATWRNLTQPFGPGFGRFVLWSN